MDLKAEVHQLHGEGRAISQDNQVTWLLYAMLTEAEIGLPSQTDHRFPVVEGIKILSGQCR